MSKKEKPFWYKLDDYNYVIPDPSNGAWLSLNPDRRHVRVTKIEAEGFSCSVSTCFLGLDHRHSDNENDYPLVFETLIFSPEENHPLVGQGERYEIWNKAIEGHEKWVEKACECFSGMFFHPEIIIKHIGPDFSVICTDNMAKDVPIMPKKLDLDLS